MKNIILTTLLMVAAYSGFAQGPGFGGSVNDGGTTTTVNSANATGNATQTVNLVLSNALDISFIATGSSTGATVVFPFTTVNNYADGLQSNDYQIKVRSNKSFSISVKSSSQYFTVTNGANTTASTMPVASVLSLSLGTNQTGGTPGAGYPSGQFAAITATAQNLLVGCNQGSNQYFNVKYKATPGFDYPAGSYSTDVIYTATQQ